MTAARPLGAAMMPTLVVDDCWNRIGVRGDASCLELKRHIHCRNCPTHGAAASALLRRELPAGYRADWAGHFARRQEVDDPGTESVMIFRVGAEWLALPTSIFQEVAELGAIHSLPTHRRSGLVLGLTNVRGELLICFSLAKLLGVDEAIQPKREKPGTDRRRLLVVQRAGQRAAFPTAEVHGIHRYHPQILQEVPATVAKAAARYTMAMLPWQGTTVGRLDEEVIFHTLDRGVG
jgi:chemotaxis-related protein WspD